MRILLLGLILSFATSGCASPAPQVKVLGVSETRGQTPEARRAPRRLLVFVEVVNPTSRDLQLSRLEYRLSADSWFRSDGRVPISRAIAADSSAVVEIPVPVEAQQPDGGNITYSLEGRLYVVDKQVERSWPVQVEGELKADRVVVTPSTRIRVADTE